jgi:hypothetical protein
MYSYNLFVRALQQYLGRRPFLKTFAVLTFCFWPVIVFWNEIRFHPARFTEEWLKLVFITILAAFLVQFFHNIREQEKYALLLQSKLKPAINQLLSILADFNNSPSPQKATDLRNVWKTLLDAPNMLVLLQAVDRGNVLVANPDSIVNSKLSSLLSQRNCNIIDESANVVCSGGDIVSVTQLQEILSGVQEFLTVINIEIGE